MKVRCIEAISSLLEVGKVYRAVLIQHNFVLLDDFPYNHFNMKYFEHMEEDEQYDF